MEKHKFSLRKTTISRKGAFAQKMRQIVAKGPQNEAEIRKVRCPKQNQNIPYFSIVVGAQTPPKLKAKKTKKGDSHYSGRMSKHLVF